MAYILSTLNNINCGSFEQTKDVYDMLFRNYTKDIRPVLDQDKSVTINVSLNLLAINDFDEVKGIIILSVAVLVQWTDENLKWDSTSTNVTRLTVSQQKVWLPRLFLTNPADEIAPIHNKYYIVEIRSDGSVTWFPAAILKATCSPDVTNFPYDSQSCQLGLIPLGYTSDAVGLNLIYDHITLHEFTQNSEWEVGDTRAIIHNSTDFTPVGFCIAFFTMDINRRPLYMMINIVVPIVLLVVVTPLVFILPNNSGERVSFTITVLLSFSVYMTVVSDKMPSSSLPVSYLSFYLLMCLIISMLVVSINVVQIRMYDKHEDQPIPTWILLFIRCLRMCHRNKCNAHVSDAPLMVIDNQNHQNHNMYNKQTNQLLRLESIKRDETLVETESIRAAESVCSDHEKKNSSSNDTIITWRIVASTLDKFYFLFFCIGGAVSSALFLVMIGHVL